MNFGTIIAVRFETMNGFYLVCGVRLSRHEERFQKVF